MMGILNSPSWRTALAGLVQLVFALGAVAGVVLIVISDSISGEAKIAIVAALLSLAGGNASGAVGLLKARDNTVTSEEAKAKKR